MPDSRHSSIGIHLGTTLLGTILLGTTLLGTTLLGTTLLGMTLCLTLGTTLYMNLIYTRLHEIPMRNC
jgi:hypothetical protein